MTKRFLFPVLLIALWLHACGAASSPPPERDTPTAPVSQPEPVEPAAKPTQEITPAPVQAGPPLTERTSDCLDGEVSPIGQSIAEDYEFSQYTEVITWFCNGAEFEDILIALETESLTGTPAEEMLQMLADGFSWEEIWQLVGLTE